MAKASVLIAACWVVIGASALPRAADDTAATEVIAVVQRMFEAMAAHDAAALSGLMLPDGQFHAVRTEQGQRVVRATTFGEFIRRFGSARERMVERMWQPSVRVDGDIATLTARYDFTRDGAFSHCGTDVFELVRTPAGWRVAGGLYTVQPEGCPPSPLDK
jgi:hypothetical protein